MNILKQIIFPFLLLCLFACSKPVKDEQNEIKETEVVNENNYEIPSDLPPAIQSLVAKHNIREFYDKEIISFDIELFFNGSERLNGTIYSRTNSSKVKVEKADGTVLLFDGKDVFITPDSAQYKGARFDALTWSYFALAPFKFADEGTKWGEPTKMPLKEPDSLQQAIKLSFENGVGDAPDDWYQVYVNPETGLLEAMAYIVTFGNTPREEAEKNPHAITYSDYQTVQGAIVAGKWKFYNWSQEKGLAEQLGEATITNIKFVEETEDLFTPGTSTERVPAGG
ncbi:hypothetical protein GCM10011506_37580 [Marivirga lumbricoides]|uniref:Uncharacterized protein n=1 Tax=Marivirga lumbricoides TaxID=1046115 RepID=A0ABQ1MXI8_9BACT|nr:hypothetical protein GCM10011506_37580 [Marivirga lumbricoides]